MDPRRKFGNFGEQVAEEFLRDKGFTILERQYTKPFGEIDLIAQDGDEIVFVEVKSRNSTEFGYPEDAVTAQKIQHLVRVAQAYLAEQKQAERVWRIDVVAIEFSGGAGLGFAQHSQPVITHLENIDIPESFW